MMQDCRKVQAIHYYILNGILVTFKNIKIQQNRLKMNAGFSIKKVDGKFIQTTEI